MLKPIICDLIFVIYETHIHVVIYTPGNYIVCMLLCVIHVHKCNVMLLLYTHILDLFLWPNGVWISGVESHGSKEL